MGLSRIAEDGCQVRYLCCFRSGFQWLDHLWLDVDADDLATGHDTWCRSNQEPAWSRSNLQHLVTGAKADPVQGLQRQRRLYDEGIVQSPRQERRARQRPPAACPPPSQGECPDHDQGSDHDPERVQLPSSPGTIPPMLSTSMPNPTPRA